MIPGRYTQRRKIKSGRWFRNLFVALALAAALFAVGCGTAEMNVHVSVTDDDMLQLEIEMRGNGLIMSSLMESSSADDLRQQGWEVSEYRDGEDQVQIAQRETPLDEMVSPLLKKEPGLFWDDYSFVMDIDPILSPEDFDSRHRPQSRRDGAMLWIAPCISGGR
jgi:hypothetical protein